MKAVITRKMVVADDTGSPKQFSPSTKDTPFVEISDAVYRRLKRAGAAEIYRGELVVVEDGPNPILETKTGTIDLDKATKAELVEYAKEKGIEVNPADTKATILAAIEGKSA